MNDKELKTCFSFGRQTMMGATEENFQGTRTQEPQTEAACAADQPMGDSMFGASLTTATLLRKPAERFTSMYG